MEKVSDRFVTASYIILADDDTDDCVMFNDAFKEININLNLITVNDGSELMDFLLQDNVPLPEMIFLDLNMPKKNGLECLNELKSNQRLKNIPVIIFSTSSNKEDIEKSKQAKAHLYITKPGSFSNLKMIIHKVLLTKFVNQLSLSANEKKFYVFSETSNYYY